MDESGTVSVKIDLDHVRRNALNVARRTGVGIYAVVKADAYGLGARSVAAAVGDIVRGFCVFRLGEARRAGLWDVTRKPTLALGPPGETTAEEFIREHVRPAVSTIEDARRLRSAGPVLSVDTGMQRFACPPEYVPAALDAGACREAFTHAISLAQVDRLVGVVGGRGLVLHAAASKLLDEPAARLDAVRPGMALYRGAVRLAARLVEVRDGRGPAGYGGFVSPRHGVILRGYSHGLRPGPCRVNGRASRLLEVGMQSAFVECAPGDRVGDEVVLLGDGLEADDVAAAWGTGPQEVLVSLLQSG